MHKTASELRGGWKADHERAFVLFNRTMYHVVQNKTGMWGIELIFMLHADVWSLTSAATCQWKATRCRTQMNMWRKCNDTWIRTRAG